jgi:hypothetical protein
MKVKDFVINTFLKLTSKTCPHGYEERFVEDVLSFILPDDIKKDAHGNYFYQIGKSRTIFASHIDTVSKNYVDVKQIFDGNIVKTDGTTTLGADDKAGVTIMLWMIRNKIPGLYYFFIGEEVGCIGSGLASKYGDFKEKYDRIISFDRRGTDSVITHQSLRRCCSDSFAKELSRQLNSDNMCYKPDDNGVYTDSAEFTDIISECTNISVGYYKEHTFAEYQDLEHLQRLALSCLKVDWENLPVDRKLSDFSSYKEDSYANYNEYRYFSKRKRRKSKYKSKPGKVYLDNYGDLFDVTEKIEIDNDCEKYSWILNKFCSDDFTVEELYKIKENYLDVGNREDKWFFEFLKEKANC